MLKIEDLNEKSETLALLGILLATSLQKIRKIAQKM